MCHADDRQYHAERFDTSFHVYASNCLVSTLPQIFSLSASIFGPQHQGSREPQRGPGTTFSRGPSGEKIFEFCFLVWRILVYFIFLSDGGPANVVGPGITYSPFTISPLDGSTSLLITLRHFTASQHLYHLSHQIQFLDLGALWSYLLTYLPEERRANNHQRDGEPSRARRQSRGWRLRHAVTRRVLTRPVIGLHLHSIGDSSKYKLYTTETRAADRNYPYIGGLYTVRLSIIGPTMSH